MLQTFVDFILKIQSGDRADIVTPPVGGGNSGQPMLLTSTEKFRGSSRFAKHPLGLRPLYGNKKEESSTNVELRGLFVYRCSYRRRNQIGKLIQAEPIREG